MGSRDHLIPSVTVDRNGHAKTVYVSPGGGSSPSSFLASAAPTLSGFGAHDEESDEYGDDEWGAVNDPESWQANSFSANDAQDWSYEGFDADDAYSWQEAGYGFSEAREWVNCGFSASDAKEWSGESFGPDDAQQWLNAGFHASDAADWRDNAFDDPSTANVWSNQGFDPREAMEWFEGGFKEAVDADNWRDARRRSSNADISDLTILFEKQLEADDAPQWLSVLESVKRTKEGKQETLTGLIETLDGVNPSAGDAYLNHFSYPKQWRILASNHVEYDMVEAVQVAYDLIDENQQDEYGDDYEEDPDGTLEEAARWMGSSSSFSFNWSKASVIHSLIRRGHRHSEFAVFLAHGRNIIYKDDPDAIIKTQQWAISSAGENAPMNEKTKNFEKFYTALQDIDDLDEIVEQHGAAKVEVALQQGMLTSPTLRNYLDHIPVAGISEGAL